LFPVASCIDKYPTPLAEPSSVKNLKRRPGPKYSS
jgi:hypothetical protein